MHFFQCRTQYLLQLIPVMDMLHRTEQFPHFDDSSVIQYGCSGQMSEQLMLVADKKLQINESHAINDGHENSFESAIA